MATLRSGLRAQGFTSSVIESVLRSRRSSTNTLYDLRWRSWFVFCQEHSIPPLYPSVPEFCRFLHYLHEVRRLSPSTIAGYKSAIALSISLARGASPSFASSIIVSHLLDSFRHDAPGRSIHVPPWDVFLVLAFLRDHCEPLASISLKLLTFKTVFLLCLASCRRVSEVHSLSGFSRDIAFSSQSVTLQFLPEFRAKTQKSDSPHSPLVIPRLTSILASGDSDSALCPVRALEVYLSRTSSFRGNKRRLFISLKQNYSSDVRKSAISAWVVATIKLAYSQARIYPPLDPIRAHEVRAIGSSLALLRGVSVEQILRASTWRRIDTFISFYLRDVAVQRHIPLTASPALCSLRPPRPQPKGRWWSGRCWLLSMGRILCILFGGNVDFAMWEWVLDSPPSAMVFCKSNVW